MCIEMSHAQGQFIHQRQHVCQSHSPCLAERYEVLTACRRGIYLPCPTEAMLQVSEVILSNMHDKFFWLDLLIRHDASPAAALTGLGRA